MLDVGVIGDDGCTTCPQLAVPGVPIVDAHPAPAALVVGVARAAVLHGDQGRARVAGRGALLATRAARGRGLDQLWRDGQRWLRPLFVQQPYEVSAVRRGRVTIAGGPVAINFCRAVPCPGGPTISPPVTPFGCLITNVSAGQDRVQTNVLVRRLDRVRAGGDVQGRRVSFGSGWLRLGTSLRGDLFGHLTGLSMLPWLPIAEPDRGETRGAPP